MKRTPVIFVGMYALIDGRTLIVRPDGTTKYLRKPASRKRKKKRATEK